MHMHVPTKLQQHVFTGEVGRKSTRGGKGRGTSEWYFGWLAKKPFHLEKTMQHTSWAAIMIWSKCTITPGSWQHSRPEHTRMPRMPTMTTETRTSKAMFTLYWIPFHADTRTYLVRYEQQRHRAGTSRSNTSKIVKERLVERVWWTKSQYSLLNVYFRLNGSRPSLTSVTFLRVNRSPTRYDFGAGAKAIRYCQPLTALHMHGTYGYISVTSNARLPIIPNGMLVIEDRKKSREKSSAPGKFSSYIW